MFPLVGSNLNRTAVYFFYGEIAYNWSPVKRGGIKKEEQKRVDSLLTFHSCGQWTFCLLLYSSWLLTAWAKLFSVDLPLINVVSPMYRLTASSPKFTYVISEHQEIYFIVDILTLSPFDQTTVGAGSPVISTSRRSLLPATTMMVFWETMFPVVSRWIFGGSD